MHFFVFYNQAIIHQTFRAFTLVKNKQHKNVFGCKTFGSKLLHDTNVRQKLIKANLGKKSFDRLHFRGFGFTPFFSVGIERKSLADS